MAIHKVIYPSSARQLYEVVALQKKLLKALASPELKKCDIDVAWMQRVWPSQQADWIRRFCLGGVNSVLRPIKEIADGPLEARQALLAQFTRQHRLRKMLKAGGRIYEPITLPSFSLSLAESVKLLFGRFYQRLSHKTAESWNGYEFSGSPALVNRTYKGDFNKMPPTSVVCPYCDGEIGTADLDHYYAKSRYPLLACSPWNLVPVCKSCNDKVTGKGDQPTLSLGPPPCADDWLHPFLRPASKRVTIRLSGGPRDSIPQLHSPDATELRRVANHFKLLNQDCTSTPSRSLSNRWTRNASSYFDKLVRDAARKGRSRGASLVSFVSEQLEDHISDRGKAASSMIKAAVCQAIVDGRPEYQNECSDSNPPELQ